MKLLGERDIEVVGQFAENFNDFASPIRGVSIHLRNNLVDPFVLNAGRALGTQVQVVAVTARVTGGQGYSFGGPVPGPAVNLSWVGTNDFKSAVIRFWDEPLPAYGQVCGGHFDALAVGAGGDSADWIPSDFGTWRKRLCLNWWGTQVFRVDRLFRYEQLVSPTKFQGGTNLANQLATLDVGVLTPDGVTLSFHNNGAVAGDVHANAMLYFVPS